MSILPSTEGGAHWRWLLLGSLALNLFFVGAAGAVAIRFSGPVPLAPVAQIDHSMAGRLDRIAANLPPADANVLRTQLRDEEMKVAAAEADLRLAQEEVRKTLRAQPFDAEAMRTAMAESRVAHDNFDQVLHDTIGAAAAKMSVVGRTTLANWRIEHRHDARPAGSF
ncbi:MAG TPA: periplasmic heavy metal sensor [Xanthobacteraceae bacterium]|nr:periplasmic heavy metal sensor [Xanthobacteraceae bacterium]